MGKTRPTHWPMSQFPVVDDCLWVGGMPLTQLAARIGQTPFYAYERRLLDQKMALLRGALPPAIELHYAVKANPMPAVVQHMAGLVDGLDVASLGELRVALDSGTNPSRISFADPEALDVTRHPNHHLSFGFGTHFCLGSSLARLEIRLFFEELLSRASELRVVEGSVEEMPNAFVYGLRSARMELVAD